MHAEEEMCIYTHRHGHHCVVKKGPFSKAAIQLIFIQWLGKNRRRRRPLSQLAFTLWRIRKKSFYIYSLPPLALEEGLTKKLLEAT